MKKVLSALLVLSMVLSRIPSTALAVETDGDNWNVDMQLRYKNSDGERLSDYAYASVHNSTLDTGSPTTVTGLTAGNYTISFGDAPADYKRPADMTLTVGENGKLTISGENVELVEENGVYFVEVTSFPAAQRLAIITPSTM